MSATCTCRRGADRLDRAPDHPVLGRDGRMAGLLITPVNLQQLQQRLFANVPGGAVSAVLDASDKVVVRSRPCRTSAWARPVPTAWCAS
jgi:hypothetical protein